MTHLLVADAVRRYWYGWLAGLVMTTAAWSSPPAFRSVVVRMAFALAPIGGWLALTLIAPGIAPTLPVSRKQVWRARWIFGVAGPALLLSAGALLAFFVASSFGARRAKDLATLSLAVAYAVATSGVMLGLVIAFVRPRLNRRWRMADYCIDALALLAFSAGPILAMSTAVYLPTSWTSMGPVTALILFAALSVALATYFYSPRASPRSGAFPAVYSGRPKAPERPRTRWTDRVTGLWRMVLVQAVYSAGAAALLLLLIATESLGYWDAFTGAFDLGLFGFLIVSVGNYYRPVARQLKTLPISSRDLVAFVTALPLMRWIGCLAVILATQGAAAINPGLLGLIGLSTLADAGGWRTPVKSIIGPATTAPAFPWLLIPILLARQILERTSSTAGSVAWIVVALCAFGLAWTLNKDTLTRRAATFRLLRA